MFIPILLGLASAACWGAGDFSGGLATKRSPVFGVTLVSQVAGMLLLVVLALALADPLPPARYLVWAAVGGAVGAIGLVALYQSLASGRMGVAAPLSAVVTAIVPVLYSYFIHGRPAVLQQLGFVLALLAITFIARPETAAVRLRDLGLPLVAGLFFGIFFILINRAGEVSVLWPLVAARVASSLLLLALAVALRQHWQVEASSLPLILFAGVLDIGGNVFFVLSGQTGRLDIATIMSSLYPGMTVLLAWVILKERITRVQTMGVLMALGAGVLIAAGAVTLSRRYIPMIEPDRIVPTTCPYCGVGCKLELHIKDDYIYKVTSPFDAIVNHGNLCVKGRFGYDYLYSKNRVTTPLIRKEPQPPGSRTQAYERDEWREVSWNEALDYIADRLVEIYWRDGAEALATYCCAKATNEDNYLMQKLFRAVLRSNNIDHCTRLCHAGSVVALQMAVGSSAMSNTAAEVIHNDVFILTGSNTAETHPIIALQMKAAVEKHGAKLIVVDPRRIEMVNYATLWLPEKPGTDVPVFSAMAHVILKEKLYNEDFIRQRTEGFEEFAISMEKFTPEYAEAISGVDRNLIVAAARLYAGAERAAIYWALGIPEHSHGTDNAMSLIHLALLTGQIGREGTGLNPLRGQNNVQGASDSGAMPWHYPGYMRVDDPANAALWEQAWNIAPGGLNRNLGLTTTEILSAAGPGGVRALYIMGENPMMSEPNLNHTRHQMEQLEFLVAQDLFINESGAFADVFLPATSWAEKEGTFTNTDRRVQRVRQAIPPRGQARPDWQIICDLAQRIERRLGVGMPGGPSSAGWAYRHPSEVLDEMGSVVPDYRGVKYDRIEHEGLQVPVWDDQHPGTPFLFADTFPRGRGKFHPLEYRPSVEMPDDEYPFILTTGRVLEHWHGGSMTRNSKLDDLYPEALMELNPADAARLQIEDGQVVRVSSRRGSVVLRAKVTPKTTMGVVFIPFHFVEAAANLLTIDALDPQAKIPEYKACAVLVRPAREEELPRPRGEAVLERGRY